VKQEVTNRRMVTKILLLSQLHLGLPSVLIPSVLPSKPCTFSFLHTCHMPQSHPSLWLDPLWRFSVTLLYPIPVAERDEEWQGRKCYVYWTVHHLDSWIKTDQLMSLTLFSAQHVSNALAFETCWAENKASDISWSIFIQLSRQERYI